MAFLKLMHTRKVEMNKMTTQILISVNVLFTQDLYTSNRLISGNAERIFCDPSFSLFLIRWNERYAALNSTSFIY